MKITAETTIGELQTQFPDGFSVGPGDADDPGCVSRILAASSHLAAITNRYPFAVGNQGYMVVEMVG